MFEQCEGFGAVDFAGDGGVVGSQRCVVVQTEVIFVAQNPFASSYP